MQKNIYSVSQLTNEIKELIEQNFQFIWINGQISNLSKPISGHYYFTLKDSNAQINAVMFKGQNKNLKFQLEDGLSITGLGRISLYQPRGTYQIIFEYLEPQGVGELQFAYEQLKNKLNNKGLFDKKYKKTIPFLPDKICVITSPTGAVIKDIILNVKRRFKNIQLDIIATVVQGDEAEAKIIDAIKLANLRNDYDVIILARGGGSLEDLYAFNTEGVARAIFESQIPIISAIGHETDFTIADFIADLRASTPSSAAELVVPNKHELIKNCTHLISLLKSNFYRYIQTSIYNVDEYNIRLGNCFKNYIQKKQQYFKWQTHNLYTNNPYRQIKIMQKRLSHINSHFLFVMQSYMKKQINYYNSLKTKLDALSPMNVLERGYSITKSIPDGKIIKNSNQVKIGDNLEIMLSKGSLICTTIRKKATRKNIDA